MLSNARVVSRALWADGRGWILVAVAAGWFLSIGVRLMYPAVLPHLQSQLGFGLTMSGLVLSVLWVCYALGQLPAGILSDRLGEGNVLVASTLLSTLTILLIVFSPDVRVLLVVTGLFGFSTALFGVARYTILANVYTDHDGTAIGLTMAAGEAGNAILPPVGAAIAGAVAWQLGFGFLLPFFLAVTALLWIAVPGRVDEADAAVDSFSLETVRYVLEGVSDRDVLLVTCVQVLAISVWQGFTGFYPMYLVEVKELSPTTASLLFGGFFAVGILVRPLTGFVGDRVGITPTLPLLMGSIALALTALPLVDHLGGIVAVTIAASGLLGYGVLTMTFLTNSLSSDMQGTGLGLIRTSFMLIGATSPIVIGIAADSGYFDEAFYALAVAALVAGVVATRVNP